jgi:hypothetical protein
MLVPLENHWRAFNPAVPTYQIKDREADPGDAWGGDHNDDGGPWHRFHAVVILFPHFS